MSTSPLKVAKVFKVSTAIIAGLFMFGVGSVALGDLWTVDSVRGNSVAICHERWHVDHKREVPMSASVAAVIKSGDRCPG
jgi:hypothetical protein